MGRSLVSLARVVKRAATGYTGGRMIRIPKPKKPRSPMLEKVLQTLEEDPDRLLQTVQLGARGIEALRKSPEARRQAAKAVVQGVAGLIRRS